MNLTRQNIALAAAAAVGVYVLLPTLFPARTPVLKKYTRGLINSGNDCYANSTFQALSALDALQGWLIAAQKHADQNSGTGSALVESCIRLFEQLTPENLRSSEPLSVWPVLRIMEALCGARISRAQQDAHEMLVRVLELLESESSVTGLPSPFPAAGQACDSIRCLRCGHTKEIASDFFVLERLPAEPVLARQSELISEYRCDQCSALTTIEKSSTITQLPRTLAVHINRSQAYASQAFRDNTTADLRELLPSRHTLKAVVFHNGNHYRGHYTCARRQRTGDKWWLISDSDVHETGIDAVLKRGTDAYMLFYEQTE